MAIHEKHIPDWIFEAQKEATSNAIALKSLSTSVPNPAKENDLDKSLVTFFEPYKQSLTPFFTEMQGAGWQVVDMGVSQRSDEAHIDRSILYELKQKYPTANISFNLNEVKETESSKKRGSTAQTWSIFTEDQNELAQIEMTPLEHEVKGFVGVKLSIKYAGISVVTDEPKLIHFVLEVAIPEEIDQQRVFIQNSLAEIIIYREKMQVLMQEENKGLRTNVFSRFEEENRDVKYHSKLQALITREIMSSNGITPQEIRKRLLVHETDYDAIRRELFTLQADLLLVYKDGRFYYQEKE